MMSRIRLICSLLCLVAGSTIVMSQTPSTFLDQFETEVLRSDQELKLSRKIVTGEFATYAWDLGEQHGTLSLKLTASEKAASDMLAQMIVRVQAPPDVKLKDLGDAAYLWQSPRRQESTLLFISGKVFVQMRGSSTAIERAARAISESAKATAKDKRR